MGPERPDLRTLPMAIFGRLNEAAERVMRAHMNPLFAKAGLQAGEFDVLATLRRSGAPYTLSPTQLYGSRDDFLGRHDRPPRSAGARRARGAPPRPPGPSRQTPCGDGAWQAPERQGDQPPRRERRAALVVADP